MKSVAGQVRAGFAHMTTCDALSTTLVTLPSIFLHVFRLISATTCGLTSISPEPAALQRLSYPGLRQDVLEDPA